MKLVNARYNSSNKNFNKLERVTKPQAVDPKTRSPSTNKVNP